MAPSNTAASNVTAPYKNAQAVDDARKKVAGLGLKKYSDVISKNPDTAAGAVKELQWVDLVTAGGGMLGIGLLGFTYILEQAGIRFVGLGGTSAGAINTMLIAARRQSPDQACSLELLEILAKADFPSFLDGPEDNDPKANQEAQVMTMEGVSMIRGTPPTVRNEGGALSGCVSIFGTLGKIFPFLGKIAKALKTPVGDFFIRNMPTVQRTVAHRGLHRGNAFEKWMEEQILPITTVAQLKQNLAFPISLQLKARDGAEGSKNGAKPPTGSVLKVVAADVTTQTRAVFPEHAPAYFEGGEVNPAAFVRASMSIPFFFFPKEVTDVPNAGTMASQSNNWHIYNGTIPDKITFVDGGMLSNFPMDLFQQLNEVPLYPTFGVMLGNDPDEAQPTNDPAQLLGAMVNSGRHILDRNYLLEHPEKKLVIAKIDTKTFFWLDFSMSEADRVRLFAAGATAAAAFLEEFDWANYKTLRNQVKEARGILPFFRR